jgi:hypothetical protein
MSRSNSASLSVITVIGSWRATAAFIGNSPEGPDYFQSFFPGFIETTDYTHGSIQACRKMVPGLQYCNSQEALMVRSFDNGRLEERRIAISQAWHQNFGK